MAVCYNTVKIANHATERTFCHKSKVKFNLKLNLTCFVYTSLESQTAHRQPVSYNL